MMGPHQLICIRTFVYKYSSISPINIMSFKCRKPNWRSLIQRSLLFRSGRSEILIRMGSNHVTIPSLLQLPRVFCKIVEAAIFDKIFLGMKGLVVVGAIDTERLSHSYLLVIFMSFTRWTVTVWLSHCLVNHFLLMHVCVSRVSTIFKNCCGAVIGILKVCQLIKLQFFTSLLRYLS